MKNLFFFFLLTISIDAISCSGFVFSSAGKLYMCASVDQVSIHGYIVVNQRNVSKTSFWNDNQKKIKWISKYGSVTFTTIGREFPLGGMNEEGLSVAIMTTPAMDYPATDNRFAINESQWIQYVLDNFRTTDELLQSDSVVRINRFLENWHYLICDKNGRTVGIEFKNGAMNIFKDKALPYPILENKLYESSVQNYERGKTNFHLPDRFSKLAYLLENINKDNLAEGGYKKMFPILDNVSQESTRWQIVYDITNRQIHLRANTYSFLIPKGEAGYKRGTTGLRSINLNELNFDKEILAVKLGILNEPSDFMHYFKPYKDIFDKKLFEYNVKVLKSQGADNISKDLVEKYLALTNKEDFILE